MTTYRPTLPTNPILRALAVRQLTARKILTARIMGDLKARKAN